MAPADRFPRRAKLHLSEDDLKRSMCDMDPIYTQRPGRMDVVFRPGDVRGNFSLDKMLNHPLHRFGLAEDGPAPIYTSETKFSAFILNQGNVVRGRKRSAPSAHADLLDYDDSGESSGALIKSIAQAKAHLFILCEAGAISDSELQFLYGRGWESFRNPARDFLVEHLVWSKMRQLTGSTLVGVARHYLHLMIVEITFGKLFPSVDKATEEAFLIRP